MVQANREGEPPPTVDQLVTALLTASRALVGVSAQSLADVGERVSLAQFRTLVVLDTHGATRLNDLAARLGVSPSTALRAVDRLARVGLVDRRTSRTDRREVRIEVSDAGRSLVGEVTDRRRTAIEAIVRAMPAGDRAHLVAALAAFSDAAQEPAVDAATRLGW